MIRAALRFSDDGKYLFFISARDFNPIYSQTEWNTAYNDMSKIYLVTLSADTKSPFAPENDMVNTTNDNGDKKEVKTNRRQDRKDRY